MTTADPFNGTWMFDASRSQLSAPPPKRWTQRIEIVGTDIAVDEEIVTSTGSATTVSVRARLDGRDHPVAGSPVADAIAYTRRDGFTLTGTGRKNGRRSLAETLVVSRDGSVLTQRYAVLVEGREVAHGVAVFQRA